MIDRDNLSLLVIRLSLGFGGSFLSAIFAAEAYLRGGLMIGFAIGVFIMVGLTAHFFGHVGFRFYFLSTVVWTVVLLAVGLPR